MIVAEPGWRSALRRWHESRKIKRHPIPERLWASALRQYAFLRRRSSEDLLELRRLTSLFLATKEFTAVGGLRLTDRMALAVAVQACLPVLRFGLKPYSNFVGIVLHRDAVVARREWSDELGIVHSGDETLAGEAMENGPVMLSWRDVAVAGRSAGWGYNVVVHEFAHVFDVYHRLTAELPRSGAEVWRTALVAEYDAFCDAVGTEKETLLDPYGSTSLEEFFAVASETFFVRAETMAGSHPGLYELMKTCFRQDPASFAVQQPK